MAEDENGEVERKPDVRTFFNNWGSFAYAFVDGVGSQRPIPTVDTVDLRQSINGREHRTLNFHASTQTTQVVVRRGQVFTFQVSFKEPGFDHENDELRLLFQVGKEPKISNGTEMLLEVLPKRLPKTDKWAAGMQIEKGRGISVTVNTPSDCIVGIWSMEFQTLRKEDVRVNLQHKPIMNSHSCHSIYILLNPWNKDDHVFMEDEEGRREYVMNDIGKIWRGVASNFRPCIWSFGQFERDVLDACMVLLDLSKISYAHRGCPISISRAVSAMVNANDDRGVLVGNWSGDYEDGTPPTDWQGSVQILQEWYSSGAEPVRYGQCWVFSGVVTTVLRALGIPARSVTNFASAHDTDTSISIDLHFNEKGKHVKELDRDSVWNFHVWNDCWMMRPDLPVGYGGWQAIDATPQEKSEGMFRVGPASLVAVRRGEVGYQYDTAFVFAEVNADKVYWLHRSNEVPLEFIDLDETAVGKFVSTRMPGPIKRENKDRDDITHLYKHPEMSEEARMVVMNAMKRGRSSVRSIYQKQEVSDVLCELQVKDEIYVGDAFHVKVKVQNKSTEPRTVRTCLRVDTMHYTGVLVKRVAKDFSEVDLKPSEEKMISVEVKPHQYLDKLQDQGSMMMSALLHIKETGQTYHAEDDFRVRFPDISVKVKGQMVVGKLSYVTASFENPLRQHLTDAKFIFEGPRLDDPKVIRIPTVPRKGKAEARWEVTPSEAGNLTILVSFTSREIRDIDGSAEVKILPK